MGTPPGAALRTARDPSRSGGSSPDRAEPAHAPPARTDPPGRGGHPSARRAVVWAPTPQPDLSVLAPARSSLAGEHVRVPGARPPSVCGRERLGAPPAAAL